MFSQQAPTSQLMACARALLKLVILAKNYKTKTGKAVIQ